MKERVTSPFAFNLLPSPIKNGVIAMEELFLEAQLRDGVGRARVKDLREGGFIPAVVYTEGKTSHPIQVSHHDLIRLVHQHRLEGVLIRLKIKDDKQGQGRPCLIKEIQYDPVHGHIMHVDFNEVSLTKVIKVSVPVVADGDPIGVKQDGGSLEHIMWEIEVECLPTNIPQEIKVDVRELKIGDSIPLKGLVLPEGVKAVGDPGAVVLSVTAPMKEEVPVEAVEGEAAKEPEVIKEKKPVEGESEAKKEE